MRLKDVVVGGEYLTKVGAQLVRVRVVSEAETSMTVRRFRVARVIDGRVATALPKARTAAALRAP